MVDLMETYDGVVSSSTDIIKNNQRHLYCNMFDLLQTTTRATSHSTATSNTVTTVSDDICKFWYTEILPICFDKDIKIQNSAIDSIDTFITNISSVHFRNNPKWLQLKQYIVDNYIDKLNTMRNESNCNWYKIWCLLIRILNQEIIRSATLINTFLSVVEQGFRSPNYQTRAEAFLCWKVLIEIFSIYNELISPKRIKLISIPLRSSHAKTTSAAINKLKVWWYFLLKLNDNIYNNCEITFEPFLQFCFGSCNKLGNNCSGNGQLKEFSEAKEMAVITLIEMLGGSHKEIHLLLEKYELEKSDKTLVNENIMQKSYKYIIKGCFDATFIILEQFSNRLKLIELLWRNLVSQIISTKNEDIYKECCQIIKDLIQTDYDKPNLNIKPSILEICEKFGTHYAFLMTTFNNRDSKCELFKISETIIGFTDILLSSNNLYFSKENYVPVIKNIYDIDEYKELPKYWEMVKILIENLFKSDRTDSFKNFEIKLDIWKKLSLAIISYLDIKLNEFRPSKKSEILDKWLLWPLHKIVTTKLSLNCIKNELKLFDDDFFIIWKKLMESSSKAQGRSNFQAAVYDVFVSFTENNERVPKFQEVLGSYINCCENNFDSKNAPRGQLDLIHTFLTKQFDRIKIYNTIIEYLNEYLASINEVKFTFIFNNIIALTKSIVQSEHLIYIKKSSCFENYKKIITDKLKSDKIEKIYLRDFKNILKNDEFTTITKVWTLNPDNLTEHQIEKMKEKNCDIPALYNDITSHSDDSNSINPWTPRKIVISKNINPAEEIVIPAHSEIINNSPKESRNSLTSFISEVEDLKNPKTVDSLLKSYCETNQSSSSTNNSKNKINNISRNKKFPKKKTNSSTIKKPSKKDEALLKKMNIHIDDEKKKLFILRNLKSISIDTIEGNAFLKSRRKSLVDEEIIGVVTRKSEKDKNKCKNSIEKKQKKFSKSAKKLLNFSNNNAELNDFDLDDELLANKSSSIINNSDEDIAVLSQNSESVLLRRGHKFRKSLSNPSNITVVTDITEKYENKNDSKVNEIGPVTQGGNTSLNNTNNKLLRLSQMETQLNTENIAIDLNAASKLSPIKNILKSFKYNKSQGKQVINENKSLTSISRCSGEIFSNTSLSDETISSSNIVLNNKNAQNNNYLIFDSKEQTISDNLKELKHIDNVNSSTKKIQQTTINLLIKELENQCTNFETQSNTVECINNILSEKEKQSVKDKELPSISKNCNINDDINSEGIIKSSKLTDKNIKSLVTLSEWDVSNKSSDECLKKTPIKSLNKSNLFDGINKSIVTSPELANAEKKKEFLNDTVNISPIEITPYKYNAEKDISSEELDLGENFIKTKDFTELIENQKLSPVKKAIKQTNSLLSPPNRKSTSNTASPGPKPKQTGNMLGRGAQFINMIRNRKNISPAKRICTSFITKDNTEITNIKPNFKLQPDIPSPPTHDSNYSLIDGLMEGPLPATPKQLPRDLLVFSKTLPSCFASPSASILKRKCCYDNIDDFDSPAIKRKRVSFHDPPVSLTKEYVKSADEDVSKNSVVTNTKNKFSQLSATQPSHKTSIQQHHKSRNSKHLFKRKSRADSMIELLRFNELPIKPIKIQSSTSSIITSLSTSRLSEISELNNDLPKDLLIETQTPMESHRFQWDITRQVSNSKLRLPVLNKISETTSIVSSEHQLQDDYEPSITPTPQIYFADESAIFKHIFDKYTIDDIFEKYCKNEYDLNNKNALNVIKIISQKMEKDTKMKTNVLEMLSEKHPKEFLDHAIQENLSSVVCDRLNSSSVIDFVFDKAKINTGVRKIVFDKMESVLMHQFTKERIDFFMAMLRSSQLTNDQILECIEVISSKRTRNSGLSNGSLASSSEVVDSSILWSIKFD